MYTIYSILFIVFIILIIVTAFITIALTYFQLAVEDHRCGAARCGAVGQAGWQAGWQAGRREAGQDRTGRILLWLRWLAENAKCGMFL